MMKNFNLYSLAATITASMALVLVSIICGPTPVWAQQDLLDDARSVTARDLSLSLNPKIPGANEQVTVSLNSFLVNTERLFIIWFVNGERVVSGIGENEIEILTGAQGEATQIEVYIQINSDTNIRKWIRIIPSDLDVVWEADTYTPPFYKGKALPTPESFIRIIGLPNMRNQGIQVSQKDVVYNWTHNYENLPEASGFGENILVIRNDYLTLEETIELTAISRDGGSVAEASTSITIVDPELVLYQDNTFMRRANRINLSENPRRYRITAQPFYYSVRPELINLLSFSWFNNEKLITEKTSELANELVVDTLNAEQGVSTISVSADHPNKTLQFNDRVTVSVIQ